MFDTDVRISDVTNDSLRYDKWLSREASALKMCYNGFYSVL